MNKISEILSREDTILFIGSGVSRWSGLPSWEQMISELAKFIDYRGLNSELIIEEKTNGDLLQAASYGFDQLTKQQIGEFIKESCKFGIAEPHEIHKKIVSFGARCYITTNYDDLLESALNQWCPENKDYHIVTNKHLTETAGIISARALNFIFKPHGDVNDSDSIILTREQYRMLLPNGERQNALESLKILLASRSVVYIGFGLRDPDFIYIKDILSNIYKTGNIDQYAIMSDVSEHQKNYWRRNFGIHITSYETIKKDNSSDHSNLLLLLDSLLHSNIPSPKKNNITESDLILSLAKHAARLATPKKIEIEFPIRVHISKTEKNIESIFYNDHHNHKPVNYFLDTYKGNAILAGLPGAGKSYSIRQAAARCARKLQEVCLSDDFIKNNAEIPIFVDLKFYNGSLMSLINSSLSKSTPFDYLNEKFNLRIYLDSFNEMPREVWDSKIYEDDFINFIERLNKGTIIVGSRTSDGLEKLSLPIYLLDQIDETIVDTKIHDLGLNINGRFGKELYRLIQKPFYFSYIASGKVKLKKDASPKDFYESFFNNIKASFKERFGLDFDFESPLAEVAYYAIDSGNEAFQLKDLLNKLDRHIEHHGSKDLKSIDIANWLVSITLLSSYSGGRISFVHQTFTEYLAAKELARKYKNNKKTITEKLALNRWDQALFFVLSLLEDHISAELFQEIAKVDLNFAFDASKYLEFNRDETIGKLLKILLGKLDSGEHVSHNIAYGLKYKDIQISRKHDSEVRALLNPNYDSDWRSAGVHQLVCIYNYQVKSELFELAFKYKDDYNFCCNGIFNSLRRIVKVEDIEVVFSYLDRIIFSSGDDLESKFMGYTSGAADLLSEFDLPTLKPYIENLKKHQKLDLLQYKRVISDIIYEHRDVDGLTLAADQLLSGNEKIIFAIYSILSHSSTPIELLCEVLNKTHIDALLTYVDNENCKWFLEVQGLICQASPELSVYIKEKTSVGSSFLQLCISFMSQDIESNEFINQLKNIVYYHPENLTSMNLECLSSIDLNWSGNDLIDLIKLKNVELALAIINPLYPTPEKLSGIAGTVDHGDCLWWLQWFSECNDTKDGFWILDRVSWLLSVILNNNQKREFISEFNRGSSENRYILSEYVLPKFSELTTDDFSEEALNYLLEDLKRKKITKLYQTKLLAKCATESVVVDYLLPLLDSADGIFKYNLNILLEQIGSRHRRRYLL